VFDPINPVDGLNVNLVTLKCLASRRINRFLQYKDKVGIADSLDRLEILKDAVRTQRKHQV